MVWFGWGLGMIGGCGQCPGTGFQKVGAYVFKVKVVQGQSIQIDYKYYIIIFSHKTKNILSPEL